MLDEDALNNYLKLGEVVSYIVKDVASRIQEGDLVISIVEEVERRIVEAGFKPAFPTNLSINETAAHYTSPPEDDLRIIPGIIKLDAGAHSGGLIVDMARPAVLDDNLVELSEVVRDALDKAISVIKPGVRVRDVSEVIYDTIVSAGFKPIRNLSGHKIEPFKLHAGVDIPNVPVRGVYKFKEGDVFAIEPFATLPNARGEVVQQGEPYIFSIRKKVGTRDEIERKIQKLAINKFSKLPFCERWLVSELGHRVNYALLRLVRRGALIAYPPLVEHSGKVVAQYEDTVLVTSEGAIRLTGE